MKRINKYACLFTIILCAAMLYGCSDNIINQKEEQSDLLFERSGLIDSLTGTCSTYITHNYFVDTLDLRNYSKIRAEFTANTDGDLSNFDIFYIRDSAVNVISLEGLNLNTTTSITMPAPAIRDFFQFRLRLFSSVCTGQEFYLKLKNLKIYGIKD